jgi:KUP system potassium uptake protein
MIRHIVKRNSRELSINGSVEPLLLSRRTPLPQTVFRCKLPGTFHVKKPCVLNGWRLVSKVTHNVVVPLCHVYMEDAGGATCNIDQDTENPQMTHKIDHKMSALVLGSLGVVFGDLGTSPLYAFKVCFEGKISVSPTPENILGIISLILWSLQIVITFKYVVYILRVEDQGEGGIFPMMALLHMERGARLDRWLIMVTLFGAALLYGDGVITPVISVLSALEGLEVAAPAAKPLVVPLTCVVLFGLFTLQSHGTDRIGKMFGPVMLLWFATLGGLGVASIVRNPEILRAVNPWYAVQFFVTNKMTGFLILGLVVLCITGCEALHADMGHFGRVPITISWLLVAMPALTLNYLGQGAYALAHPEMAGDAFYGLTPSGFLYPMVALSTAATIIASQAIISGAFSQTRQAIQLGFLPRFHIVHTSSMAQGQIYIPEVNITMMITCLALTVMFKESGNLAEAYGIAVTATMFIATILFYYVAVRCWHWPRPKALALSGFFLASDVAFLGANMGKFFSGGWLPVTIALILVLVMTTWQEGWRHLGERIYKMRLPIDSFIERIRTEKPLRVPGTAVFLSTFSKEVPPMLASHVAINGSLHEKVVLLSVLTEDLPHVPADQRLEYTEVGEGLCRLIIHSGFMETPDVPEILSQASTLGLDIDPKTVRYYFGRISLVPARESHMLASRRFLFSFLQRNAISPAVYYNIPPEQVLEMGVQIRF